MREQSDWVRYYARQYRYLQRNRSDCRMWRRLRNCYIDWFRHRLSCDRRWSNLFRVLRHVDRQWPCQGMRYDYWCWCFHGDWAIHVHDNYECKKHSRGLCQLLSHRSRRRSSPVPRQWHRNRCRWSVCKRYHLQWNSEWQQQHLPMDQQ